MPVHYVWEKIVLTFRSTYPKEGTSSLHFTPNESGGGLSSGLVELGLQKGIHPTWGGGVAEGYAPYLGGWLE